MTGVQEVSIKKLIRSESIGREISEDMVESYAEDMNRGDEFPPVVVFSDNGKNWLSDGFHRCAACEKNGTKQIAAEIWTEYEDHEGKSFTGEDAALLYAAGANREHGLRCTNTDKQEYVIRVGTRFPEMSDRWIAEEVGVDEKTVRNYRSTAEIPQSDTRVGRDGKIRRMPTKKPKPLDKPEPEPKDEKPKKKTWYTLEQWEVLAEAKREEILEKKSTKKMNRQDGPGIEWAQWSWNPITGCLHGCPYCYARDIANRFYPHKFKPTIHPERLQWPGNTNLPSEAKRNVAFRNVFTCSMADLFGRWVPREWIDLVMEVVARNSKWNFLFLTKFPQRFSELGELPKNAWMGTTVDCQARVTNAEKAFAKVKHGTKWISVEPMLTTLKFKRLEVFDWVVIGGATSSSQTPAWCPPFDWIVELHDQARKAGCAIYHKENLFVPEEGAARMQNSLKEFPWTKTEQKPLPKKLQYLGMKP